MQARGVAERRPLPPHRRTSNRSPIASGPAVPRASAPPEQSPRSDRVRGESERQAKGVLGLAGRWRTPSRIALEEQRGSRGVRNAQGLGVARSPTVSVTAPFCGEETNPHP